MLERETLRDREHWRELRSSAPVERRLALGCASDLHADGPQQDDSSCWRRTCGCFAISCGRLLLDGDPRSGTGPRACSDDLEAQLLALDGDLRRLSTSVQSPFLLAGVAARIARARRRTPSPSARGSSRRPSSAPHLTDSSSESQEIALLALVQEALSNVRKHGDASAVRISITPDPDGIRAQVSDDGRGFVPETTVANRAARAGRLGLVGMQERASMLGGQTHSTSRPGGSRRWSRPCCRGGAGRTSRPAALLRPARRSDQPVVQRVAAPRRRGWARPACDRCWWRWNLIVCSETQSSRLTLPRWSCRRRRARGCSRLAVGDAPARRGSPAGWAPRRCTSSPGREAPRPSAASSQDRGDVQRAGRLQHVGAGACLEVRPRLPALRRRPTARPRSWSPASGRGMSSIISVLVTPGMRRSMSTTSGTAAFDEAGRFCPRDCGLADDVHVLDVPRWWRRIPAMDQRMIIGDEDLELA